MERDFVMKISKFLPLRFKIFLLGLLPPKLRAMKEIISKGGVTFSQNGEDLIIRQIFNSLNIKTPSYLDIGAHDPFYLSNTAIFYQNGSQGVNIEPNPILCKKISKYRKGDMNLSIGVGASNEPLTFYVLPYPTNSTFSKQEADFFCEQWKLKIVKEISVEVRTLKFIIENYCGGVFPDFLSLDAEGLDIVILSELKELSSLPKVICTELNDSTLETIGTVKQGREILEPLGYTLVMKTHDNAIFVLKDLWQAAMN